ncbi:MAG TPA: hypothetical protein VFP72_19205 [Kineosporiaceae bacterium]|nr:hypothetical protein [Kineosporiaceae bacterium]
MLRVLRHWPVRRWSVAAVVMIPLAAAYAVFGPAWAMWWGIPVALLSAGPAALILASYVPAPGSGSVIDAGCSPCATVAIAAVFGSFVLRDTRPTDGSLAVLGILVVVFGLGQRLNGTGSCRVPG